MSSAAKGAARERRVMELLRAEGFLCHRSPGSKGIDIRGVTQDHDMTPIVVSVGGVKGKTIPAELRLLERLRENPAQIPVVALIKGRTWIFATTPDRQTFPKVSDALFHVKYCAAHGFTALQNCKCDCHIEQTKMRLR